MEAFERFTYSQFEDSVTPQWKSVPFYSTRSGNSHERNARDLSGFSGKKICFKYADLKVITMLIVLQGR
jgi:hypothetical protein